MAGESSLIGHRDLDNVEYLYYAEIFVLYGPYAECERPMAGESSLIGHRDLDNDI